MKIPAVLEGSVVAILGGAVTAAIEALSSAEFNPGKVKQSAAVGALIGLAAWLKQSPMGRKAAEERARVNAELEVKKASKDASKGASKDEEL